MTNIVTLLLGFTLATNCVTVETIVPEQRVKGDVPFLFKQEVMEIQHCQITSNIAFSFKFDGLDYNGYGRQIEVGSCVKTNWKTLYPFSPQWQNFIPTAGSAPVNIHYSD